MYPRDSTCSVNLALGLLAAFGIASIATRIIAPWRPMVVGLVIVGIIAEYASAPALADAPLAVSRGSMAGHRGSRGPGRAAAAYT